MTAPREAALAEATRKAKHTQARDDRLQRCYQILCDAAAAHQVCPTNQDLSDMLGYSAPNKASEVISLIEVMGLITVQRGLRNRVVTIVKTGDRTAGVVVSRHRKPSDWTEDQDAILMDGLAEGVGFTPIGKMLGKSKHACISRFNKIRAEMGAQAA
ncbi:SANT/Myb-like DNA-binding domain-containing protein [Sphingobium yanoikuyae]|uniref:SANT/Myb-like DNA-binding domain-containing protein n=1 Tax=Sphingobium yanoikuyae TaxID=13690 RepID=UPI000847B604|nr:SANT/Myb-like DNA-binding domain-containing protein [Sphingobium yanoikuyae]